MFTADCHNTSRSLAYEALSNLSPVSPACRRHVVKAVRWRVGLIGASQRLAPTRIAVSSSDNSDNGNASKVAAMASATDATFSMDENSKPDVLQPGWLSIVWNKYSRLLDERPVLIKSLTSLVGFMIGDLLAQTIVGNPYNVWRTVRLVLFGVVMDGPVGHVWYTTLDKHVWANKPKSNRAVLTKMLLDQLVWAPFFSCIFFTFICTLEGRPDRIMSSIQTKLVPMLLTNYAVWPIAHIINFKYIPSSQRILYINCCQILWSAYMSNCQSR